LEAHPATAPGGSARGLTEAAVLTWRERASERTLRRDGRRWTLWTLGVVVTFGAPAAVLVAIEPLAAPAALFCGAHAVGILHLQARRGARAVVPIGGPGSAALRPGADPDAERVALGLLGDLLGHSERELASDTGFAIQRGRMGIWLSGEAGALLVRPGGRRVDCWCVRVSEAGELPAGDRVAHLLLALREDEAGFATVANSNFSGSLARVRRRLPARSRPALDEARRLARAMR